MAGVRHSATAPPRFNSEQAAVASCNESTSLVSHSKRLAFFSAEELAHPSEVWTATGKVLSNSRVQVAAVEEVLEFQNSRNRFTFLTVNYLKESKMGFVTIGSRVRVTSISKYFSH